MAEQGLVARVVKRRRSLTRPGRKPAARDHVRRQFNAVAPNLLWCGDLTEIVTDEGKLYQASVLDLFSRKCLGLAFSVHQTPTSPRPPWSWRSPAAAARSKG